ncbi:MAG: BrnT family toxin, partial [Nitrosopumilaceae archaeon]|nr:BrnT family toxin [Nitrosopumilaceae archaeon]NIU87602.1 BrnT family toxin [Nitrosopumilaceae archaeon]NIV66038.1 BrnT family toxin [Nitrosopumilaceae archaeon]NIX61858.1 BrnT family toxin [Nitrosopumilaceae archaeon]
SLTIYDPLHSDEEDRFVLIGSSHKNRLLVVVHTERGDHIRIISARKANKNERKYYEKDAKRS